MLHPKVFGVRWHDADCPFAIKYWLCIPQALTNSGETPSGKCCDRRTRCRAWCGMGIHWEPGPSRNAIVRMRALQMVWRHKQNLQTEENRKVLREILPRCGDSWGQAVASSELWMSNLSVHPGQHLHLWSFPLCVFPLGFVSWASSVLCLSGQKKPLSRTE